MNPVNLDGHEIDLNILEPISFEELLLEVQCNLPSITKETISAQFEENLAAKVREAREVFRANLPNLLEKALATRKIDGDNTQEILLQLEK